MSKILKTIGALVGVIVLLIACGMSGLSFYLWDCCKVQLARASV